jgi:hypothetical protein
MEKIRYVTTCTMLKTFVSLEKILRRSFNTLRPNKSRAHGFSGYLIKLQEKLDSVIKQVFSASN